MQLKSVLFPGVFSFKSSRHTPCAVTGVTIAFYMFFLHISKLKLNMKPKTG